MPDNKNTILYKFLTARPAVTLNGFARECGINISTMRHIKRGRQKETKELREKMVPVMRRYGYDPYPDWEEPAWPQQPPLTHPSF